MKVRILVSFKDSVLDPQGQTVKNALHTLGYDAVKEVRQGKVFELELVGVSEAEAGKLVPEVARKVLANPIIEKYTWQIVRGMSGDGMKFGVVMFPGSNCDHDTFHVLKNVLGRETVFLWHKDHDLRGVDVVVLPGGFSYGDYLRAGAIARFSPLMQEVRTFARRGGRVLGICNGFQILLELGLLPGAMLRNKGLKFLCEFIHIRVENARTDFTRAAAKGRVLKIPIAHFDGNYYAPQSVYADLLRDEPRRLPLLRRGGPGHRRGQP